MVSYKKKIEECYTKCSMCGRIFNNENMIWLLMDTAIKRGEKDIFLQLFMLYEA